MVKTAKNNCLIISYARHEHLQKIINQVEHFSDNIYIYQNVAAPNRTEECAKVKKVILQNIDRLGEKIKLFHPPEHLKSEKSIHFAISYFFSKVDFGVIFEDDCIPSHNFWNVLDTFRQTNLATPKMVISGFTPIGQQDGKCEIRQKRYLHVWGWSTNARTWNSYLSDYNIQDLKFLGILRLGLTLKSGLYWFFIFRMVKYKKIQSWDYKFLYYLWVNRIPIYGPSLNLIQNMGADEYSEFLKKDIGDVENIKVAQNIDTIEFKTALPAYSCKKTDQQHYKITWLRILQLFLINMIMRTK